MQDLTLGRGLAMAEPAVTERALLDVPFNLLVVLMGKPNPQHPPHTVCSSPSAEEV